VTKQDYASDRLVDLAIKLDYYLKQLQKIHEDMPAYQKRYDEMIQLAGDINVILKNK